MRLVIDIPDNEYQQICELRLHNRTFYDDAIRKGIPLEKIRAEIYCLHHHPKLDFIKNDDVVDMALDIIDKYTGREG